MESWSAQSYPMQFLVMKAFVHKLWEKNRHKWRRSRKNRLDSLSYYTAQSDRGHSKVSHVICHVQDFEEGKKLATESQDNCKEG